MSQTLSRCKNREAVGLRRDRRCDDHTVRGRWGMSQLVSWFFAAIPLASLLCPGFLVAQPETELGTTPSLGYLFLKVALALAVTGGLVFLTVFVMRRFLGSRATGELNGEVRLVGSVPLAPKKQIFLVRCFDRLLVIGASESQMTLLSEITDLDLIASLDRQKPRSGSLSFKPSFLKNLSAQ